MKWQLCLFLLSLISHICTQDKNTKSEENERTLSSESEESLEDSVHPSIGKNQISSINTSTNVTDTFSGETQAVNESAIVLEQLNDGKSLDEYSSLYRVNENFNKAIKNENAKYIDMEKANTHFETSTVNVTSAENTEQFLNDDQLFLTHKSAILLEPPDKRTHSKEFFSIAKRIFGKKLNGEVKKIEVKNTGESGKDRISTEIVIEKLSEGEAKDVEIKKTDGEGEKISKKVMNDITFGRTNKKSQRVFSLEEKNSTVGGSLQVAKSSVTRTNALQESVVPSNDDFYTMEEISRNLSKMIRKQEGKNIDLYDTENTKKPFSEIALPETTNIVRFSDEDQFITDEPRIVLKQQDIVNHFEKFPSSKKRYFFKTDHSNREITENKNLEYIVTEKQFEEENSMELKNKNTDEPVESVIPSPINKEDLQKNRQELPLIRRNDSIRKHLQASKSSEPHADHHLYTTEEISTITQSTKDFFKVGVITAKFDDENYDDEFEMVSDKPDIVKEYSDETKNVDPSRGHKNIEVTVTEKQLPPSKIIATARTANNSDSLQILSSEEINILLSKKLLITKSHVDAFKDTTVPNNDFNIAEKIDTTRSKKPRKGGNTQITKSLLKGTTAGNKHSEESFESDIYAVKEQIAASEKQVFYTTKKFGRTGFRTSKGANSKIYADSNKLITRVLQVSNEPSKENTILSNAQFNLFAQYFIKTAMKKVSHTARDPTVKALMQLIQTNLLKNAISAKLEGILDKAENDCARQIKKVFEGLKNKEEWALMMLDASAKISPGYFNGRFSNNGEFGECLRVKYRKNDEDLTGKYCTASIQPHQERGKQYYGFINEKFQRLQRMFNMTVHGKQAIDFFFASSVLHGFCVPNVCNAHNLNNLSKIVEEEFSTSIHFVFYDERCQTNETRKLTKLALATLIIFGLILTIVLISTLYDCLVFHKSTENFSKLLISFSLYTNGKNLLSSNVKHSNINCLNGIRVLSMFWVLLGHRYLKVIDRPVSNTYDLLKWLDSYTFSLMFSAVYAVDTFFAISGFLLVFLYLRKNSENKTPSMILMIIQRFIRLTPLLLAVMALEVNRRFIITGPLAYKFIRPFEEACETHWWATLFYFSNYHEVLSPCVVTTWYLGADTHLYLISPIILLGLIRWPKIAISGTLLAIIACLTFNMVNTFRYNLPPLLPGTEENGQIFYYTHTRMGPWLVGVIFGYIVFTHQNSKKLNKGMLMLCWLVVLLILIGLPLNIYLRVVPYVTHTTENAILNGMTRSIWAVGICGLIYLCRKGQGGFINTFLSSPVFNVGYRVNYAMYLIHMLVIDMSLARKREIEYFDDLDIIRQLVSDYAVTLVVAIILTLTIEIPFSNLGKCIFEKGQKPKPNLNEPKKEYNKIMFIDAYNLVSKI